MNTNTIAMTAKIPSGSGMPICGHLPQMSALPTGLVGLGTTSVVRDRQAAIKGDMGFAYVPGTNAWRPPSS
ncbi:MAG: hypothetical protein QOD98_2831 [Nocardioidaceae bacterium]|jgi:hypothetical protein|nr:hypothetical protein [Nocardioidaceae bacterium]